jgi:hypothetical protein
MTVRSIARLSLAGFALVSGCEETPRTAPGVDASAAPPPPPPPREGCARTGNIDSLENDPTCVIRHVGEDAMRAAMKSLTITTVAEPAEVAAGGTALLHVTIKNTGAAETTVFFETRTRMPGPRTDWTRVVGIPEARGTETPKLLFPMTTTDSGDRDVDALPTIAGSASVPPPSSTLAVHLRPGGKLTHTMSWWALRIPAPAPVVQDDAGHRYVPKTSALPLTPGDYNVIVELPFVGLTREERKTWARMHVIRAPKLDAGTREGELR